MEIGSASYPQPDRPEAHRAQVRQATRPDEIASGLAAMRRDNVPTLAEVMSAVDMVTGPDGASMPAKLAARGDRGFGGADENRDSADAERLTRLVREMDRVAAQVFPVRQVDNLAERAYRLAELWTSIRDITQANTDRPNREEAQ